MVKVEIKLRHTRTKVEIKLRHTREIQSQRISLTNIRNFNRTFSSENVKKRILILSPRQENWEMVNSPSHSTNGFKRIFFKYLVTDLDIHIIITLFSHILSTQIKHDYVVHRIW